jgi:putative peptidoglycan lipid II flippase
VILLRRKIGPLGARGILRSLGKNLVASLLMGVSVYLICLPGEWATSGFTPEKLGLLVLALIVGISVYGLASYLLRSEEIKAALDLVRNRLAKNA